MNSLSEGAWRTFVPYSGLHFVTVGVCLLLIAGLVATARILRHTQQAALRRGLAIVGIVFWLSYNIWWNRNGLDIATGLPLQICDINGMIAPLALFTLNRWLRATLYFWAFALTTQAFIQPALPLGPANILFWWFWGQHTIILGSAVFDVVVLGFRPEWQDLGRAYAASVAYLAIAVPLDLWLGADYGYLGNLPLNKIPPFVAALGPWPTRAIIEVVLAAAGLAAVELPWQISFKRKAA